MKAIIIPSIATVVSLALAWAVIRALAKKLSLNKKQTILTFCGVALVLYFGGAGVYFGAYYHATEEARSYLNSTEQVRVTPIRSGYLFDGPGEAHAMIFYPGAKVDEVAYAELMHSLAAEGLDCFLVRMPLHMAFLGKETAGTIQSEYDYPHWYMGGHSLGGAIGAIYCAEHSADFDGVALLAAFASKKLPDTMSLVSIVGSNDQVLNWDSYRGNQVNNPQDAQEFVIEGGNHCQFGDYGMQKGDGTAQISREAQLDQTVPAIMEMIE